MILLAFIAVFVLGGALGALAVLVAGIHNDERRMSLKAKAPARTRTEVGARRVLGVGVRNVAASDQHPDHDDVGR